MKVYIVYIMSDYATAVYMGTNKKRCEQEAENLSKRANGCQVWVEEYILTENSFFELESD